jgi:hypothetical protein
LQIIPEISHAFSQGRMAEIGSDFVKRFEDKATLME